MKTRQILLAMLLIVTLTLIVSCNNEVVSGPGYGSVTISTGNDSKSVQPAADKIAFSYYIIHCSCSTPGINPIEKRFEGSSVNIENMVEGQWTLYVEGFNSSDELIGKSAPQNVTIVRDSITNLHFMLAAINGQGTLSLSINVQTSKVSTIDCALKIGNENYRTITLSLDDRISNNDGTYTFSKVVNDIANGFYSSTVTMKDSEKSIIGIALTPAIHIYANLESAYVFSWENLEGLLPSVDTPIPSVNSGRYSPNIEVSFSTVEEGTTIWYSLNGADFEKYTEPLFINDDSRLRLYSTKPSLNQSEIVEYSYICRVKTPVISLESGKYTLAELTNISISETDQNAIVYYTLDGSDPSVSNTRIEYLPNTLLSFDQDSNLRIIAIEEGFLNSDILDISYVVAAPTPEPLLPSGTFIGQQELAFTVPEGSQVYYTCDGSIPTTNSTLYTEPILLTEDCVIKAITVKQGVANSSVAVFNYFIESIFNITASGHITPKDKSYITSSITIPRKIDGITVRSIDDYAFSGCTGLTSMEIPDSVTSIGERAFYGCTGLTSIEIPNSVTSIGGDVFENCNNLTKITIPFAGSTPTSDDAFLGYLFGGSKHANESKYTYREKALEYIPSSLKEVVVTSDVMDYAFYGCTGLTSMEIPDSVTSIGEYAFYDCTGLTSIEIPNSVTIIGAWAFSGCTGMTRIEVPDSVKIIGTEAFENCTGLTTVIIGDSVEKIYDYTFHGCTGLTNITIPSSVTSIGNGAFSGCTGLTSITIPSSVTSIGYEAFYKCTGLESVYISDLSAWLGINFSSAYTNPMYYATYLYLNNNLVTEITIPNSVTSIGRYAFYGCKGLTSIEIPNSVTSIGEYAFYDCTGLTSIEIPNSVTSIGSYAFSGCTGLTSIVIPNSVTSIGERAFDDCEGLTSITIPNSVTSIGDFAFSICSGLTSIEIPSSVTSIGRYAFSGCTGLTSITIGNSVTSIGECAFYDCTGLISIEIPNSVTSIGNYTFRGCTGLTSIVIPNSVTSIGSSAFYGCTSLTSVHYLGKHSDWLNINGHGYLSGKTIICTDGEFNE